MLTPIVLGLAGAAGLAFAGFEALYRRRDRGTVRLLPQRRTPWQALEAEPGYRRFACRVPLVNDNRLYEQTLVDMKPSLRVLAKDAVTPREVHGFVTARLLGADGREDGYWQANLFGPGETLEMELVVEIAAPAPVRLHAAVVSLEYKTYGRGPLQTVSDEIVLPLSAVKPLPEALIGQTARIQCVPTPILTDIDDIVEVIDTYTKDFRQPGDIVAVAESVVAITQHQYFRPQDVTPGFWAKRLCYFVPSKGSLSSQHGFQCLINQVGAAKVVPAFFIGALGKLVGKKGWFYELAGKPAELIDDVTGTMPPFDKYIVAGPKEPEQVVARIKARTGMHAAIVDANDLKRAMVLAATPGLDPAEVSRLVLDNPFGNAAEQTPIVVIRRLTSPERESTQRDPIGTV